MEPISAEHSKGLSPEQSKRNEEIPQTLDRSKHHLHVVFGVDDLSTIEEVRLRDLVGKCLEEYTQSGDAEVGEETPADEQRVRTMAHFEDSHKEAVMRWLWELYGITPAAIPVFDLVRDKTTHEDIVVTRTTFESPVALTDTNPSRKLQDIRAERANRLLAKEKELRALGHDVEGEDTVVPEDFKEYLGRLREKSHMP
ncbi:MAG: hypothetical protein AAB601_01365 [Patescibacteria group bacterium]